ncbi:glycosyltransferase family 4 protein [Methanocaldococcus fervens]|uniref:Glycosyl transferase group 1 n=1 Tax=Methanocaldococcus fervens (strain DSM 4213 / JCM 15782 / AG86) TaxID=573064 RepID=C7P609_METFA|nr:glycosyltransferase family 4 protein [Methanocaldococcus fervens]ACV23991.1 glycosyl transferase group 1 [Methanocaldococcus fervens AG86]
MKVLMPTIYYPHVGGITIHVENLVKHLKDIEFHILTYDNYEENEYKNVVIHKAPYLKKFRGMSYLLNAYTIGKNIIEKEGIDLIHSHYAFPQGCVGALLKNKFSLPHVLTLHGSDALILKNSLKGKYFFNYAVKNSDKIICVSKYIKEQLGENLKNKAVVIYNGVDKELLYNEGDYNFGLFVGAFVSQKGVDILIEAIKDINFNFKLIGDGILYKKIEDFVRKNNLNNIELLGKKSFVETASFMRKCSFLVVPSRSEGFGMVAVEAMACSKPVIATNVGGLKEIVTDKYNGLLVEKNNPKNLKEKILELINDENLRKTLGKNGKEFSKNFSWKKCANNVREVYEELIKN